MAKIDVSSPSSSEAVLTANSGEDASVSARHSGNHRFKQSRWLRIPLGFRLGLILFPGLFLAVLNLDVPTSIFDGLAPPNVTPSLWISLSDVLFGLSLFAVILLTRRYGGGPVRAGLRFAWLAIGIIAVGLLIYLAPQLVPGDIPPWSFAAGTFIAWYFAPVLSTSVYDLTRGGRWWRAPLFAGAAGLWVHSFILFGLAYIGRVPDWGIWWVTDLLIKTFVAILFIGPYFVLRRRIRPRAPLGGA